MSFQVIPAIDLRDGRCVRLFQGDFARETVYGDDPVAVARRWESLGATLIHVVDLDGAKQGRPVNGAIIRRICAAVQVPVEVSGGLRTLDHIAAALDAGASYVQIGSVAVTDPEIVRQAVASCPGRVAVSIDARDGQVMTDGWLSGSGRAILEIGRAMAEAGVTRLMITDISRDGAMQGPNIEAYREYVRDLPVPVVASGGVTSIQHLCDLAGAGCTGAVVGRALYEGTIDLREAIAAVARC